MQLTVIELTDMIKERGVPVGQNKRKVNLVQRIMVRFLLHLFYCPGQLSVEEHTVLQHPGRIDAQIPLARDLYSNKRSMMPMQTDVDVAGRGCHCLMLRYLAGESAGLHAMTNARAWIYGYGRLRQMNECTQAVTCCWHRNWIGKRRKAMITCHVLPQLPLHQSRGHAPMSAS